MRPGVYRIRNLATDKSYVGGTRNLRKRRWKHESELRLNRHYSKELQSDFNRYGESGMVFEVLEYCNEGDLLKTEQKYLDLLNPAYNTCENAGSPLGVKFTEEHKQRISNSLVGIRRPKGKDSPRSRAIVQLDSIGCVVATFGSLVDAQKKTGARYSNISSCCNGRLETSGGYRWMYLDDFNSSLMTPERSVTQNDKRAAQCPGNRV